MVAREVHALEVEGSSPSPASMTETLENTIRDNAIGPKSASGDAGSVEQHSLTDQIAADKHIESKKAMGGKGLGIKLLKISPGGTV